MASALDILGFDFPAWLAAWARVLPTALLVPAFGLRFLPAALRAGIAAALALAVFPAVHPVTGRAAGFALSLVAEFVRGMPIALAASAMLFAATMAGGLLDDLRAVTSASSRESPMSTLFGLLAAVAFLETGGASRVVGALTRPESGPTLAGAAFQIAGAVSIAVAILGPIVIVAILLDVMAALIVRTTGSWPLSGFIVPLRTLVILASAGIAFERLAEAIVAVVSRAP